MNIPKTLFAGDKIEWTESVSSYLPSDGWTYKYVIINNAEKIELSSTPSGDSHSFVLEPADTADWTKGTYIAQGYVEHTNGTYEIIGRVTVQIKENLITANTYDFRSHARKTLEAIEAAIERRASKEQLSISISSRGSSRQLQYMTMEELIKAKDYYQKLVSQEEANELIEQGKAPGGKVLLQFK